MNPFIVTIVGTLLHLKRTCPKCGKPRIVPSGKKKETVLCKYCKSPIPPPKESG